jgi:cytoskeletal protein RodZ
MPAFQIPPSFASFFLVAAGYLILGLGPLRDFLASWNLLNASYLSFFIFGVIRYAFHLNRYQSRLGEKIKSDPDYSGSGLMIILSLSLAFFIHYETFTFWQDIPWTWYWLPVVGFVAVFWWLAIWINLAVLAPFMFFFNESAVRRFLVENHMPQPVSGASESPAQASPKEASQHDSESTHRHDLDLENDTVMTNANNANTTYSRSFNDSETENDDSLFEIDSDFSESMDCLSLMIESDEAPPAPTIIEQWREFREDYYKGEANVHESTSNVDTYTLEAALFGGLAFSSIVSIVSSDRYENTQFSGFVKDAVLALSASMRFDFSHWKSFASPDSDWILPILLALSIFSGAFFLASLFCRIPFSRAHRDCKIAYDRVGRKIAVIRKALRRARRRSRKKVLERRLPGVDPVLREAITKYEAIDAIVNIMRVFRIAGLVAISLILVAVCARMNFYLCWAVIMLIAIGFSNMVGAPMAKLAASLRSGRTRQFALRRR